MRGSLTLLAVVGLGIVLQLLAVGQLQETRDQQVLFDQLRHDLANGTAPIGPTDFSGRLVRPGTPVALLEIPTLHERQVVLQGSSSSVTAHGPGHRADSVMPGQPGSSIIMGRAAAYGGPFAHLGQLRTGDTFTVTTGQGVQNFSVIAIRRAGDVIVPLAGKESRLTLITAEGPALAPSGILRVDARLTSAVKEGVPALSSASITNTDRPMGTDYSHLSALILWLELLLAVTVFTVWSRARWGRWQTWLVSGPVLLFVGVVVANHVTQMLPNLL